MTLLRLSPLLAVAACASSVPPPTVAPPPPAAAPRGPYLGEVATDRPAIFGRGVLSRRYYELNAAFSPDGNELFYTLADAGGGRGQYTLLRTVRAADGAWSEPEVAAFSGRYPDADPFFTVDGKRLYFISRRPESGDGAPKKDYDIWYVERAGDGWGAPVSAGAPINSPDDEFYVSVSRSGTLYWSRKGDILRAIPDGGGYRVEPLGPAINTPATEGDMYVAPDESYLIFAAARPEALGSLDLFVSFARDGQWQPAQWLGPAINTTALEYCPIVSPDGKYLFFTSLRRAASDVPRPRTVDELLAEYDLIENGMGNVYWMKADFLEAMRAGGPPPQ